MGKIVRCVASMLAAFWVMGQASCSDTEGVPTTSAYPAGPYSAPVSHADTGVYTGGSRGVSAPVAHTSNAIAVSWTRPSMYWPNAKDASCRNGFARVGYQGKALCAACGSGAHLKVVNNEYHCAWCPSGYAYYSAGNHYSCRT